MVRGIQRELAAILFADIVGFTSIMANNETKALDLIKLLDNLIFSIIDKANGKIIKKMGDGYLIKFNSSVDAVKSSIEIQESIKQKYVIMNDVKLRIGIHLGDIVIDGDDVMGDGVNIASRIEAFAEPGGVCMTQAIYQSVKSNLKIEVKEKGEVELKNIVDKYNLYKYPKNNQDDNTTFEEMPVDEKSNIKISGIKKITPITRGVVESFFISMFMVFCIVFFVFVLMNLIDLAASLIFSDQSFTFRPLGLKEGNEKTSLILLSIYTLFIWIMLIWKSYRISCADINSVNSLLDYCVKEMGYIKKRQSGTNITYVCGICGKFEGLVGKYSEFMGRISVRMDGNVLTVTGPWNYVNKLIKNLKSFT